MTPQRRTRARRFAIAAILAASLAAFAATDARSATTARATSPATTSEPTRITTDTRVIVVDSAAEWRRGLGHALDASRETGLRAGLVLLAASDAELQLLPQLQDTVRHHGLAVDAWVLMAGQVEAVPVPFRAVESGTVGTPTTGSGGGKEFPAGSADPVVPAVPSPPPAEAAAPGVTMPPTIILGANPITPAIADQRVVGSMDLTEPKPAAPTPSPPEATPAEPAPTPAADEFRVATPGAAAAPAVVPSRTWTPPNRPSSYSGSNSRSDLGSDIITVIGGLILIAMIIAACFLVYALLSWVLQSLFGRRRQLEPLPSLGPLDELKPAEPIREESPSTMALIGGAGGDDEPPTWRGPIVVGPGPGPGPSPSPAIVQPTAAPIVTPTVPAVSGVPTVSGDPPVIVVGPANPASLVAASAPAAMPAALPAVASVAVPAAVSAAAPPAAAAASIDSTAAIPAPVTEVRPTPIAEPTAQPEPQPEPQPGPRTRTFTLANGRILVRTVTSGA